MKSRRGQVLISVVASAWPGCQQKNPVFKSEIVDADAAAAVPMDTASPPVAGADLLPGLVGYWKLDDLPGSDTALDSSGNANHGKLLGIDATGGWVAGLFGGALDFSGRGYVRVPRSTTIDSITAAVTIAAWVFLDEDSIEARCVASRQVGTSQYEHYGLFLAGDGASFWVTDASLTGRAAPSHQWVHVAATYDGAMLRLYLDGIEIQGMGPAASPKPDQTPFLIGANDDSPNDMPFYLFKGRIDELLLYNRALDASAIRRLSKGERPPR